MTIREAIHDLRKFLASYNVVEESKLTLGYSKHLINTNRSFIITEDYYRHQQLDQQLFQSIGIKIGSKVNYSDNLDEDCTCFVAKFDLPPIAQVRSDRQRITDLGIGLIKSTCGLRYSRTTFKKFLDMMSYEDQRALKMNLFWHIGNAIYAHPYREQYTGMAILEDPMDGKVIRSVDVAKGELTYNETYKVTEGTIKYDTGSGIITIQRGQTFTANTTGGLTWTGDGIVEYNNVERPYTLDDELPMNSNLWGYTKQRILKELSLGSKFIGDTVHDGADEESMRESSQ